VSSPAIVRVRLRFADVDTFVERFAPNVTRGGLFLATRNLRAVGEIVAFEILLADGTVVLAGDGKVSWTRAPDPSQPTKPFGMGLQFVALRPASRAVLVRLLKAKESRPTAGLRMTGALPTLEGGGNSGALPVLETGRQRTAPLPLALATAGPRLPGTARVDTNVDLAAEMGFDDGVLRDVASRLRRLPRAGDDAFDEILEELLKPAAEAPATLARALGDLPRLLGPAARRRASGVFRALGVEGATAASFVRPDVNAEAAHAEPSSATPAPLTPASHGDGDAETAASELQIAADAR
jgi:uncharacterized protein (TIGR02266 family)